MEVLDYVGTIFTIVLLVGSGIFCAIFFPIRKANIKKYKTIVTETSSRIEKIKLLNDKTHFHEDNFLRKIISLKLSVNSRKKLNDFDFNKFFYQEVDNNYAYYFDIYLFLTENQNMYKKYIEKLNKFQSTTVNEDFCKKYSIKLEKYLEYEDELFKKYILHPIQDTTIAINLSYTTPAGRATYTRQATVALDQLGGILNYVRELRSYQETKEYKTKLERSKVTNSIRYDVLKRDNFKCQICGRTAQDGVKLHIDHIKPISKGGKTIMSNLRTLCDKCNLGKSDKLE